MGELEQRLRRDAESIDAPVSPELASRLKVALASAVPPGRRPRDSVSLSLWLAASLSGAAAAVAIVLLLPRTEHAPPAPTPAVQSARLPAGFAGEFPLAVRTAELTAPLEEELRNLQSDIEKARARVKEDLDF